MKALGAFLRLPTLPARAKALALEAALLLLLARLLVACVPMRHWGRRLDMTSAPPAAEPGLARKVGRIVRKVARRAPFRAPCLPQAMAAQWMLRRRGIPCRMVFGVRRGAASALEFHAWLHAAGECVIGAGEIETYSAFPPSVAARNAAAVHAGLSGGHTRRLP